ncbi:Ig-like domain-containing protein, partial [Nocardioides stalactiti]|uniref:Ig-like domain-containing protein n=1 Tax=Nocardioides stalactiti TaxID=2755356 RepID=UPI00160438A9
MRGRTASAVTLALACSVATLLPAPVHADDPVPGLPPPAADVWDGSCDDPATGTTYDVGPGRPYTTIGAVPWLSLGPGDRVRIHARPAPYKEKILVVGQGTESEPLSVCGVADSEGNRPVIDGADATTRPDMRSDFEATQQRGVITLAAPDGTPWGTKPRYVVIDGLEVTGGYPGNTFTDWAGITRTYPDNVAGIFVERGEWVTVRDTVIRGNANGLFVASGDEEASVSRHVLVDGNAFLDNSVVGRDREHHSYIEAEDVVYQFNHYGDTRAGSLGGALKDRSTGTVVRFNEIEGGLRAVDLVEAQDSFPIFGDLPAYRETWVYGNVVDLTHGDAAYAIHYGGDSGSEDTYRKGTLYFFNNTVVYRFDQSEQYNASVFDLATPDETAEIWGNVFSAGPATTGATPLELSLERGSGVHHLGVNVMSPAMVQWRSDTHTGSITGWSSRVTAANLGFTDLPGSDFRPTDVSPLVDVGATAPVAVPARHALAYQYVPDQLALGRPVNGPAVDAGAYENGPATSVGDPGPDLATPAFTVTVPALRYGEAAAIGATVTGDGAPATGTVTLREGARVIDTSPLSAGTASLTVAAGDLSPGSHALVVEYGGDESV